MILEDEPAGGPGRREVLSNGRQMEHARHWFVDLSRFMMGGEWS